VIAKLHVHTRGLHGAGCFDFLSVIFRIGIEVTNQIEAIFFTEGGNFRLDIRPDGLKSGLFYLLEFFLQRPFPVGGRLESQCPEIRKLFQNGRGLAGRSAFHEFPKMHRALGQNQLFAARPTSTISSPAISFAAM